MQPSKEREASDGDPMDDLDGLLDDDLAGAEEEEPTPRRAAPQPSNRARGECRERRQNRRLRPVVLGEGLRARALVTVGVGMFVGGLIPLIGGTIGTAGGVFLAAFLLGLVVSTRRYVETGIAGAAAGATSAVTSVLGVGFLPIGIDYLSQWGLPLVAVGGGVGLVLALLGHYFGRDLRAGLTEDIDG